MLFGRKVESEASEAVALPHINDLYRTAVHLVRDRTAFRWIESLLYDLEHAMRALSRRKVLLLTTTGRKSGAPRVAPLIYLRDGERLVLVASKGGMDHHPLWYHNLVANPEVEVQIGAETRPMTARTATPAEKAALWPKVVAVYRDYADYQARTTRDIPAVILSPR